MPAAIHPGAEVSRLWDQPVLSLPLTLTFSYSRASPSCVLQMLLLLSLLLTSLVPSTMGKTNSVDGDLFLELRCMCLRTISAIRPNNIQNLEVIKAGPHCAKVEVIATLKNGNKLCLDPESPRIKKIMQKILKGDGSDA
ncbi:platelet basic protein-like [Talpa occidentalis]|uniref:platelet basic protein-like n=1 Tax=Talpa occidentalis TaxID=50954 RepID=UPI00188F561E|nr:platelet basic protein-like [Talpa occidentalis]